MDAVPGGKRMRVAANTWMSAGSKTAQVTEWMNRVPMYLFLKEKGHTPKQAADIVEKLHVNYDKLAPFEKNVAKRAVPFYSFQSRMIPLVMQTLVDRPGGLMAQSMKASTAGRDPADIAPADVASQAAIPLNPLEDGTKRYATGFGMLPEVAAPYMTAIPGVGMGNAIQEAMSATSPLLKYPMELATGQTFFQKSPTGAGRELTDLDPTIGRTLSNARELMTGERGTDPVMWAGGNRTATMAAEHALANTPLTKYLSTARTLTDPRKWEGKSLAGLPDALTNTVSPARITAVSPQRQERLLQSASNKLADQLGAGTWSNRYFTDKKLAQLERDNPLLAAQARQLKELWSESKRTAKKVKGGGKKKARTTNTAARAEVNRLLQAANGR
jgi:hypothetical protein